MVENIIISPSLLSCDFAFVNEKLQKLKEAGITNLHLDVMDGIFVPNISFGQVVIKSLRKSCDMFFDTHLMITQPQRYIDDFVAAGSDRITVHLEAFENREDIIPTLQKIRAAGVSPSISIKPGTAAKEVFEYLPYCDCVLVMTVEPGFGGQKFMADMLPKIKELKAQIEKIGADTIIQVDGGIDVGTAPLVVKAGATDLVAGSSVFKHEDLGKAANDIRAAAMSAI